MRQPISSIVCAVLAGVVLSPLEARLLAQTPTVPATYALPASAADQSQEALIYKLSNRAPAFQTRINQSLVTSSPTPHY